jgi:signal transduction histidine kinase
MSLNNQLLQLSQNMAADYTNFPGLLSEKQKSIQDQYATHKAIRSYTIIILILLMLVVSVVLFNFTRMAFEYEKRLTVAEQQIRQSLDFKNRITGMISHEIRSPLSIISMYSKKASAATKDEALKETIKSIEFTTNSLLLLSNQILEYSKSDIQELTLKNKKIPLKTEIDHILETMTALVATRGNRLEINSNLEEDCEVYADSGKIHQLFYNIIGNANKFTQQGWIKVVILLEPYSEYETNLKVTVTDNGIGIAAADLKNIFESYYQGTVSEKVNDLGVGLGLNICKEIIELFDGEIRVQSEQGNGTKVAFNLILAQI